jgi:deoxyribose-phosphate aldolase
MKINPKELVKMIDVSFVAVGNTEADIQYLIEMTKKYQFICAFAFAFLLFSNFGRSL